MKRTRKWVGIGSMLLLLLPAAWGCASSTDDGATARPRTPVPSQGPGSSSYAGSNNGAAQPPANGAAQPPANGAQPQPSTAQGGNTSSPVLSASGGSFTFGPSAGADEPAPPPNSGDKYEAVGTNPFVLAEYDPLSTFAADADTASYDIFRRDVQTSVLPQPESVRLEEYVNSFAYQYPAPESESEVPFSIHLAAAPNVQRAETLLLRVGIQGKLAPADPGTANLVFLIDVSGSMAEQDKLPLVKTVLTEALDVLKPTDKISIVTYAGATLLRLPPTPVANKAEITAVIQGLEAGGSTAGGAGMQLAYDQARAGFIEGGINHVVMCTDGDFNVGLSSDTDLLNLVVEKRKSGVTLTTLGFGSGNLNDSMMEKVSNAGNGMYSVISNADQAIQYAHGRLLSTMIHIAKDMKIQVEFNANRVLAYRLLGYEDRAIADTDFRDDQVDAGEVGAGHRVTALYEVVPKGAAVPAPSGAPALEDGAVYDGAIECAPEDIVLVKIRYKQPGALETDAAAEVSSSLSASDVADSSEALDADFKWAVAVASFAEILKQSPYAEPAHLEEIAALIQSARGTAADRMEFETLFKRARALLPAP
ncbi:MAG TPA: von Willebrand factor type A domain-containing protein [Polyangiaceae bacterium]|nr:von Willebrand factor type A domain-containing protein [Polyangiaceae bacterium]